MLPKINNFSLNSRIFLLNSRIFSLNSRIFSLNSRVFLQNSRIFSLNSRIFWLNSRNFLLNSRFRKIQLRSLPPNGWKKGFNGLAKYFSKRWAGNSSNTYLSLIYKSFGNLVICQNLSIRAYFIPFDWGFKLNLCFNLSLNVNFDCC